MKQHTVVRQDWLESEAGWGVRPDGYTLHLSEEDRELFIEEYWAGMPDAVPSEYSRPCGGLKFVEVDQERYEALQEQRDSKEPFGVSCYGLWF